jgi:RNA polymerase sigma factor (sigma-70 family)
MQYPEHSVARGVQEGDPEAIGQVIRWISTVLTWPRFWSIRQDWPDLVQESLTRVLESLRDGRYDPVKDFHFYVQGIARHTAVRAVQKGLRWRGQPSASLVEGLASPSGPALTQTLENRDLVRRVMDLASEECRLLLRLHFLEEKAYEQIARDLLLPEGTVKSRLSRCLVGAQRAFRVAFRRPHEHADD